jgi:hypothetical protein
MVKDTDYVAKNSAGYCDGDFLIDEAERREELALAAQMRSDLA